LTKDGNGWLGSDQPARYQIKVRGRLTDKWSEWFSGMAITFEGGGDDAPTTTLTGAVADQSTLRGILTRIWDLNLTLISVVPIKTNWEDET
jgi:hypothetical protein